MRELEKLSIKVVTVPKNMTHLLQPLDLTTNAPVKKMKKNGFSYNFTSTITETLDKDPYRDVATIEVDLKLSSLKPIHAKLLRSLYEFLQVEKGRKNHPEWMESCRNNRGSGKRQDGMHSIPGPIH